MAVAWAALPSAGSGWARHTEDPVTRDVMAMQRATRYWVAAGRRKGVHIVLLLLEGREVLYDVSQLLCRHGLL